MEDEEAYYRRKLADPRSTKDLVAAAMVDWDPVTILQCRGTREVFDAAVELCTSPIPRERELGADILGQIGTPERAFPEESVDVLLRMLEGESNVQVLYSVAVALGHRGDPRCIAPLSRLRRHPSADVRFGVVMGLLTFDDEMAVQSLIELSRDEDEDVRNWATFGLGSQIDADTWEIRQALLQRLDDEHHETRGEAMVGLARRQDGRVIEPLIRELSSDWVSVLAIEAAREMPDPRLHAPLRALRDRWPEDDDALTEAIDRSRP